ncbi:MAG: OsmC family protein [Actinobacteria bacterium]|nr:OsmC family protein [Actinomycetota bacterium]
MEEVSVASDGKGGNPGSSSDESSENAALNLLITPIGANPEPVVTGSEGFSKDSGRNDIEIKLELEDGLYGLRVHFPNDVETLLVDEPEPLGKGQGPSASGVLGAAVASCLSASLLFCLRKAHIEVSDINTSVTVSFKRDEKGKLRIGGIKVNLSPEIDSGPSARMARCMDLFEDFCVVTQSVRKGIDVDVTVDVPA